MTSMYCKKHIFEIVHFGSLVHPIIGTRRPIAGGQSCELQRIVKILLRRSFIDHSTANITE